MEGLEALLCAYDLTRLEADGGSDSWYYVKLHALRRGADMAGRSVLFQILMLVGFIEYHEEGLMDLSGARAFSPKHAGIFLSQRLRIAMPGRGLFKDLQGRWDDALDGRFHRIFSSLPQCPA